MNLLLMNLLLKNLLLLIDMWRILNSQRTVTEHAQVPASLMWLFNYFNYFKVYDLID